MNAADEWEDVFADFGVDHNGDPLPCTVETLEGQGSLGPRFSAPKDRPGLPQFPQNRLVRTSGGNEVLSSARLYAPQRMRADFTIGSRVTLADGRQTVVLTAGTPDMGPLFAFVEVNLE